ncbi:MAG: adenylosuccinate synthase [Clostridia bacterium]|nr:adenylosuccinate synthase [Clostridia bacterium]
MATKMIVGLQYGDEGKGRAVHYEAKNASIVIRATGGSNAGHTVVANGKKYAMHLLPSAIIRPDVLSMIGPGVVADLKILSEEIAQMREAGIKIEKDNFAISERTHITLPHHKQLDRLYEMLKENKVGTTGRGVGTTYEEKARRTNLRMCDLFQEEEKLKHKITENLKVYNVLVAEANFLIEDGVYHEQKFPIITTEEEYEYCMQYKENIQAFITDTHPIIDQAIENNALILIEGAQSFWLDNDHGDYPMTTSSNPNASGTASGAGVGPTLINEVIGVMKAYTSRVGNGPFITELEDETGNLIREWGHEYGTTTGRPRRTGWLDLVMIKHTKNTSGLTSLCVNHLDTIGKLSQIQVCVGYQYKGKTIQHVPIDKENCKPIYQTLKGGWTTEGVTTFEQLPKEARDYIYLIEKYTGVPVKYIGVGADEKRTIIK